MSKAFQWGTGIYDSEHEIPLSGSASGQVGGLRLKRIHVPRSVSVNDLPDPLCFHINVGARMVVNGEVVLSPKLFTELLGVIAEAKKGSPHPVRSVSEDESDGDEIGESSVDAIAVTAIDYEQCAIPGHGNSGYCDRLNAKLAEGWHYVQDIDDGQVTILKRMKR